MSKQLNAMRKEYGKTLGRQCRDCCNFVRFEYRDCCKCRIYGIDRSACTDWNPRSGACGRFNVPLNEDAGNLLEQTTELAGQIGLFMESEDD